VPAVDVIDTLGAGDAFAGGLLAWWDAHRTGREALVDLDLVARAAAFAVRVATPTCDRPGADPPTAAELGGLD
jgi:fructokinase